jgi:hypothetical protein
MKTLLLLVTLSAAACAPKASFAPTTCQHALTLYSQGDSVDQVAEQLHLGDRETARAAIHEAMRSVQKRFYADRAR